MTEPMQEVLDYLESHRAGAEEELKALLSIPSISTQRAHDDDVDRCARFVAEKLEAMGCEVAISPTERHPIVFGRWDKRPDRPTVLIYGHYDVQPPDPLDAWETPPFEPTIRDENIYARGASDDKGQFYTHLKAVEAWLETEGELPVNVKFLIEGEEEIGSPNLAPYIESNRDLLACDEIVISDTAQLRAGVPAVTYGLKGLLYFEIRVDGPKQDLHSGMCGGTVMNPANALASIVAGLHDDQRRITVPGFYDDVRPLTDEERQKWAELDFDEQGYRTEETGVPELVGEAGYTTLERKWARPTCDVNGIWGGYTDPGAKTIIPAHASAKISFRIVPDQDPDRLREAFRKHVKALCPPGVSVSIKGGYAAPPVLVPIDSPGMQAAADAMEEGFGRRPVFIREGGTIPVVSTFQEELGVGSLLLGYGRPDDNIHSPNEKLNLLDFHRGCRTSAILLNRMANLA